MHHKGPLCLHTKKYFQLPHPHRNTVRHLLYCLTCATLDLFHQCVDVNTHTLPCYYLKDSNDCKAFDKLRDQPNDIGWVTKPGTTGGNNWNGVRFWGAKCPCGYCLC